MTIPEKTSRIEIINPIERQNRIRFALFDFDGTLSLIREGWQGVMVPMMVDILSQTSSNEDETTLTSLVKEYVDVLTGKQTIYQMIRLCEEIEKRGGDPLAPLDYKHQYLKRLDNHIKDRIEGLQSGNILPEDLMVMGSVEFLEALRSYNVHCYLASGTDEEYVLAEAKALRLDSYFDGIYGARDDYKSFSKKIIIEKILQDNDLAPQELIVFGDGYVEIECIADAGGIAVGVATNERDRGGIDEWKRKRLIQAGADIIIPDFGPVDDLVKYLFIED